MLSNRELLLIGKRPRGTIGQIADRHHRRDLAAERHSLRCGSEKLVERAALVRLDMRERDIPERSHRHDPFDRLANRRKQHSRAGVEAAGRHAALNATLAACAAGSMVCEALKGVSVGRKARATLQAPAAVADAAMSVSRSGQNATAVHVAIGSFRDS